MRKRNLAALFLTGAMVLGMAACGTDEQQENDTTGKVNTETTGSEAQSKDNKETEKTETTKETEKKDEDKDASEHIELYKTVLDKYYQAIDEKWNEGKLSEEGLSTLLTYCYDGEALKNIAYGFVDIDNDGSCELFIEPVSGDEFVKDMIFEMYTLKDGKPVQVLSGNERNRYYLSHMEEGAYIISNYASSGASQSTWNYFTLEGDQLTLQQGVIYDAEENEDNPWSLAYAVDGNEDATVDEKTAKDIIDSYESTRIQPEATDFSSLNK